jgi:MFS family permease
LAAVTEDHLRGRAYGLHRALDSLGAVLGVALSFALLSRLGRREILLLALIPAAGAVLILFLLREPPSRSDRWKRTSSARLLPPGFFPFLLFLFLITLADLSEQFLLLRARSLGFGEREAVGLYLVFSVFYALLAYPAGFLSDRVGRAPVLIGGYAFSALVYLGFGLLPSPDLLWLFFAAQGAYLGLAATVERAVVAGSVPLESRGTALGLYHAATGAGLLLASVIAGLLWDRFGPRAPFLFAGGLTLILLLPTALSLRALRVQRT